MDYRFCGRDGEPEVACVDGGRIKFLAGEFGDFVRGPYTGDNDEYDDDGKE